MGIKIPPKIKEFTGKIFTKEKLPIILLFGILIVIISIPIKKNEDVKNSVQQTIIQETDYTKQLEKRLADLLEKTEGVGKVKVMVTTGNNGKELLYTELEESGYKVSENNSDGTSYVQEEKEKKETVIYTEENGVKRPYVQEEEPPKILGVVIVAQGGGNANVDSKISEAVSTLLGVPINKIRVFKMEV